MRQLIVVSSTVRSLKNSSTMMNAIESTSSSTKNASLTVDKNDHDHQQQQKHKQRGAFILLEGIDRCGKTTQSKRIYQRLISAGIAATTMNFPDRTTTTGLIINQYLQSKNNIEDHTIHLLFSANRWENSNTIYDALLNGTTIICDRYAYSGVAFSSAKINDNTNEPILSIDWCKSSDRGLPAPDCVLFLDIPQDEAQKRGGYGEERYEKRDMQIRVREQFHTLQQMDNGIIPWNIIDATKLIDDVENDIWDIVKNTIENVKNQSIHKLWE